MLVKNTGSHLLLGLDFKFIPGFTSAALIGGKRCLPRFFLLRSRWLLQCLVGLAALVSRPFGQIELPFDCLLE